MTTGLEQGVGSAAGLVAVEAKLEPLSRGAEREELGGDEDTMVPVIVTLADKERKSVTTQVPLRDIINGAPCTLQGMKNQS